MVEAAGGVPFSIVFFDGHQETHVGNVVIYPSMIFKKFQSVLSRKIGISKHQFSTYLCKNPSSSVDSSKKVPVTGKINFAVIMKEKDCFFLAVLKKSRGTGRRSRNREFLDDGNYSSTGCITTSPRNNKDVPEKVRILQRNTTGVGKCEKPFSGIVSPIEDRIEYEKRVRNFQVARYRYVMHMGLTSSSLSKEKWDDFVGCEECMNAKTMGYTDGEFHFCVHDEVIVSFRSTVGPVARPTKGSK